MQALQVILFSDGRPGHEKQSRGIVKSLQDYIGVEVQEVLLQRQPVLSDIIAHLSYSLRLDSSKVNGDADLIIGTGSRTHLPVLSAGRRTRARTVTCMSPMSHLLKHFDLCCVPIHDQVRPADNIFFTVGPPNVAAIPAGRLLGRRLVLVGGEDKSSHTWDDERIVADIFSLIKRSEQIQWLISSSPRTPEFTEKLLKKRADELENAQFLPFSQTDPGWVEDQYRLHEAVWVTADSISMVYEALSAGCRVGVLPVPWKKADNKFQRSLSYLRKENLIVTLSEYLEGTVDWLRHEPLNEADRCAREILRRWWPKSLQ